MLRLWRGWKHHSLGIICRSHRIADIPEKAGDRYGGTVASSSSTPTEQAIGVSLHQYHQEDLQQLLFQEIRGEYWDCPSHTGSFSPSEQQLSLLPIFSSVMSQSAHAQHPEGPDGKSEGLV